MSEGFWIYPLVGGMFIGLSATLLLALEGRVMGVSGIVGGLLQKRADKAWRWFFLAGMLIMGLILLRIHPAAFSGSPASTVALVVAGLLVGVGTRLGNGCTSGHGVCGMSRLSVRSIAATCTFMAAGFITVWLVYGGRA